MRYRNITAGYSDVRSYGIRPPSYVCLLAVPQALISESGSISERQKWP